MSYAQFIPVGIQLLSSLFGGGDSGGGGSAMADPFASQRGQYQPMLSMLINSMFGGMGFQYNQPPGGMGGGYGMPPGGTYGIPGGTGGGFESQGGWGTPPGGSPIRLPGMPPPGDTLGPPPPGGGWSMPPGGMGGGGGSWGMPPGFGGSSGINYDEIINKAMKYIEGAGGGGFNMPAPPAINITAEHSGDLSKLLANPGEFASSPLYKFIFAQGQQGVERSMGAKGMLGSGNRLAALTDYGQGIASQQYFKQADLLTNVVGQERQASLGAAQLASQQWVAQQQMSAQMLHDQMQAQLGLLSFAGGMQQQQYGQQMQMMQLGAQQQQNQFGNSMSLANLLALLSGANTGSPSTAGQLQGQQNQGQAQMWGNLGGSLFGGFQNWAGNQPGGANYLGPNWSAQAPSWWQ